MSRPTTSGLSAVWARWYRRALPTYWVFLFCLTHFPKLSLGPRAPRDADKAAHFLAFAMLAFVYWRFNESFGRALSSRFVWAAAVILIGYAALDEYLQGFVNRSPDVFDWLFDSAGIVAALLWLEYRRRRLEYSKKRPVARLESGPTRT